MYTLGPGAQPYGLCMPRSHDDGQIIQTLTLLIAQHPKYDFDEQRFRAYNMVDGFNREMLAIEVKTKIGCILTVIWD